MCVLASELYSIMHANIIIYLKCLWNEKLFLNTIKAHKLKNQFQKNEINVACTFRDIKILNATIELLTQFNVTNYRKLGIEYRERRSIQLDHWCWNILLLSIAVELHTSLYTLNAQFLQKWISHGKLCIRVYSSKTVRQIFLKFSVNVPARVFWSKSQTCFLLHIHFKSIRWFIIYMHS